jgi:hypothetical protein
MYIIEDIHEQDAWHDRRDDLIGKCIKDYVHDPGPHAPPDGFKSINIKLWFDALRDGWTYHFYAVKIKEV